MGVRKNLLYMPTDERDDFFEALLKLKAHIVNPAAPVADQYSVYDQFTSLHYAVFAVASAAANPFYNAGHGGPAFLSWHRELLLRFEQALQNEVPGVMLPYWDWSPSVFTNALMGPDGGPGGAGGGDVETGWFAYDRPGTPGTPNAAIPLPGWWPASLPGWRIRDDLSEGWGERLQRFMATPGSDTLPVQSDVSALLAITAANPANAAQRQTAATNFRSALEQGSLALGVTASHNEVHRFIDGHMGTRPSPNDPIFWLHHCNIDRMWAMWQLDGKPGASWYPVLNSEGHRLTDPMWPWVGAAPAYLMGTNVPTYYIPSFAAEPARLNQDVLDHHALGYAYDTEPVLGVALDRSFSMTGASTDPFDMGAPTTKWELAKLGVSHLLADCEAAYAAREAYVIGGVQTFTTGPAGNDVSPVIAGKDYGLIRSGANYPEAYPAADVDAGLAATGPAGATPLAAALTQTHADVVRPPANALPADDVRYLSILTDGKETAAPLLSTIAAGQLAETYVFGMGFGSGTGWDGVDHATIQTIVSKGKTPPPALGLTQVFQGETMGAIDKFYSSSVAHVIGYTPVIDPRFELFPGEHIHLPFWATSAEDGFMITLLRGDEKAANWHVVLVAPDGRRYDQSGGAPYFITVHRRGRRDTIFLRRARATDERWIGRWLLHIAYCCGDHGTSPDHGPEHAHEGGHDHEAPRAGSMAMQTRFDLMLPSSAPPVVGPLFAQFNVPSARRVSTRLLKERAFASLGAPVLEPDHHGRRPLPSALVVNVHARTTLRAHLDLQASAKLAGQPVTAVLRFDDTGGGSFTRMRAQARLVAPGARVGAAFLDTRTIPLADRKKYLSRGGGRERFDELRFLADYERKKPGAFAPRDEALALQQAGAHHLTGRVERTEIAGVYRVGAYLEGYLQRPGRKPEYFTRSLSSEVSLGVQIDPQRSGLKLRWQGTAGVELTLTPQDRFGNLVSPTSMATPLVELEGRSLDVAHEDRLDGSHHLKVALKDRGKRGSPPRLVLRVAGQSIPLPPAPSRGRGA
jgi:hypothetical protein